MTNVINVFDAPYNLIGDGTVDVTSIILNAINDALSKNIPLYLPAGVYIAEITTFNESLKIIGPGVIKFNNTIIYSENLPKLGLPHNINQKVVPLKFSVNNDYITTGKLINAPLIDNIPNKGLDIIAYWYNDFGLRSTLHNPSSSNKWYDWSWNHSNLSAGINYDPKRHPLLGWYRGDDPKALDWICYWLGESGVNVVAITLAQSTLNWKNETDASHWVYQLMENTKNFKPLKYVLFIKSFGTITEIQAQNDDIINNILGVYDNIYLYNKNNKNYVTLFCFDLKKIRRIYDGKTSGVNTKTLVYLIDLANKIKQKGYDGLCLMARKYEDGLFDPVIEYLESNGVVLLKSEYSTRYAPNSTDADYSYLYEEYVENVNFPIKDNEVINVVTSAESRDHPSKWNLPGSTPELFKKVVDKAVNHIHKNALPKMLTIYNVSEWAEGGAGLQPNQADLFGYLDAVKNISNYSGDSEIT